MIEQITIRNFKSIGKVTVDLSPVTVLIGRSGAGKSNFLRAIRFLRNYLLAGEQAVEPEGGWHRIAPNGLPQPLSLSLRFRLPGFEPAFDYYLGWSQPRPTDRPQLTEEKLCLGNETVFSRRGNAWDHWPGEGSAPGRADNRIYLNDFPTTTEAVLAFAACTNGIGWHDFPGTVLSHPEPQVLFGGSTIDLRGLHDNAGNYLSVIRDLTQDLRDQSARRQILARLRQINPTVTSVELDSIQKPQHIVVGHEMGGSRVALDLSQESDGFRRYYAHLLALYQTPPKQVLMFEEPENGVYPGAMLNLSEEFAAAPIAKRGQVLLATQSPELLDGFALESIRVVDLDPQSHQTRIGPLDPDQADAVRQQLLEPGELLTVDQARIAGAAPRPEVAAG